MGGSGGTNSNFRAARFEDLQSSLIGPQRCEQRLSTRQNLLDRRAGLSQKKIAPKFEEYLKEFLAWSKQHHKPKTTALHSTNCDTLKRFFKGHWLDEIDQAAVEQYKSDRIKEDRRNADDGSKITGATVNRSLTTLKLMFGRAEKCGFGVSNPVRGVAYLRESTGRVRVVSFQEELAYLSKASQPLRDIAHNSRHRAVG